MTFEEWAGLSEKYQFGLISNLYEAYQNSVNDAEEMKTLLRKIRDELDKWVDIRVTAIINDIDAVLDLD